MDQVTTRPAKLKSHKSNGAHPAPPPGFHNAAQATGSPESEGRSRRILAAMMAFSDGEFAARLPSDWSGTDGRIAKAFNRTIGNAARITAEADRLRTTVGKEGRLSQRMVAPGAWWRPAQPAAGRRRSTRSTC